jgi:hypothetical protein
LYLKKERGEKELSVCVSLAQLATATILAVFLSSTSFFSVCCCKKKKEKKEDDDEEKKGGARSLYQGGPTTV